MEIISTNPATLEEIGKTVATDPDDVSAVVNRLRCKLPEWCNAPLEERIKFLKQAAATIRS